VSQPEYQFDIDKNTDARNDQTSGVSQTPYRAIEIRVRVRDKFGRLSASDATLSVTNPSPLVSELAWSITAGHRRGKITITQHPLDNDYVGCEVFISTSNDIPQAATRIGQILKSQQILNLDFMNDGNQIFNGTTYFVRLVPYDEFSIDLTNTTSGFTFVPVLSGLLAEEFNATSNIAVGASSSFGSNGFQVDIDPYGNMGTPGFFCGNKSLGKFVEFSEPVFGQPEFQLGENTELSGADTFNNKALYDNWIMTDSAFITDGSGSVATGGGFGAVRVSNVSGSDYLVRRELDFAITSLDWAKSKKLKLPLRCLNAPSDCSLYIVTGRVDLGANTGQYAGFRIRRVASVWTVYCVYHDGTSYVETAIGFTFNFFDVNLYDLVLDVDAGTITYFINGTQELQYAVNSNTFSGTVQTAWMISMDVASAGIFEIDLTQVKFLQSN